MTLIVSMIIIEGIVIAGDSLATMMGNLEIKSEFDTKCPKCSHIFKMKQSIGGIQLPKSTLSFAQKVFPFFEYYGVGTFGIGTITNKTIYYAMMELEKEIDLETDVSVLKDDVTNVAEKIGNRAMELLHSQEPNWEKAKDDWLPLGFHIIGYDKSKAKIIQLQIGKEIKKTCLEGINICVSGETHVVQRIFDLYEKHKKDSAVIGSFSLQDAIDYSGFLISTTAKYQRFSGVMPNVGGDIDIGLVTPFHGFRWIQQKQLGKILGGSHE